MFLFYCRQRTLCFCSKASLLYIFRFISTSYDTHLRIRQHQSSILGKCRSVPPSIFVNVHFRNSLSLQNDIWWQLCTISSDTQHECAGLLLVAPYSYSHAFIPLFIHGSVKGNFEVDRCLVSISNLRQRVIVCLS